MRLTLLTLLTGLTVVMMGGCAVQRPAPPTNVTMTVGEPIGQVRAPVLPAPAWVEWARAKAALEAMAPGFTVTMEEPMPDVTEGNQMPEPAGAPLHPPGTNYVFRPRAGALTWLPPMGAQTFITNQFGDALVLSYAIACCTNHGGLDFGPTGTAKTAIGPAAWRPYWVGTNTSVAVTATNREAYFVIEAFYAIAR